LLILEPWLRFEAEPCRLGERRNPGIGKIVRHDAGGPHSPDLHDDEFAIRNPSSRPPTPQLEVVYLGQRQFADGKRGTGDQRSMLDEDRCRPQKRVAAETR
jgi:hypothetical protein